MDDIIVFSKSHEEHVEHHRFIFSRLQEYGLVLRRSVFLEFLGYNFSASGLQPQPAKVEVIRNFPVPCTIKKAQEFAGMINHYHKFLPKLAEIMRPIYLLLAGRPKELIWGQEQKDAFLQAKNALANASLLVFPQENAPLSIATDASDFAIGGVLHQAVGGQIQPLGFFSRKLSNVQQRYSTFDKELLAAFATVRHCARPAQEI